MSTVDRHRLLNVLLAAMLVLVGSVALSGGQPGDAVEGPVDVVYVASGRNFPDALVGGGLAVSMGAPMLTVEPSRIPDATATALTALDPDRIIVLGGPGAVSDDVIDALRTYARSGLVERIEGADRHGTAAAIAAALPDKVTDADHLDGLDSTDFLRTTDADDFTTEDDLANERVLALSGWTYVAGAADTNGLLGPWLPEVDVSGVGVTVMVPPQHEAGTGLDVDVSIAEDDAGACGVKFTVSAVGSRRNSGGSTFLDWHGPGATTDDFVLEAPGGRDNHAVTFTLDPAAVESGYDEPGTALTFIIYREPAHPLDTCVTDVSVTSAQLRY